MGLTLVLLMVISCLSCKDNGEYIVATKYMQNVAKETNQNLGLPAQIDEYTRADKVVYNGKTKSIIYYCTLTTSDFSINEWKGQLKIVEKEQIASAKELHGNNQYYRTLGVTIESVYNDVNGNEIHSFKIKPEQYLK